MTADDVLTMARAAGILLEVRGDILHVEGPRGALTPVLRDALALHKPALLARLAPIRGVFVTLKNGPTLPVEVIEMALDLERRGFRQSVDRDGRYQVEPATELTEADRAALVRWRLHLGAIVSYGTTECV